MKSFQKRKIPAILLSSAVLPSISVSPVQAQESMVLEEVIVTARRRVESIQEAPLAISALTGDMLKEVGITNLADVTELVPNLQISRPARDANIYIRGVGPARGATNVTELSVGVYIDDVFVLKPQGQLIDLAEIESVQVLRGPQGTLFGKNTTGGALVVTTVKPVEEFGGFAQVTAGNDDRLNLQASIDVPITDTFLSKLTVTSTQVDGIDQDPESGKELSDEDRLGALLQFRWLASEEVTADFSLYHNRIRENLFADGDCVVTNPDGVINGQGLITPLTGLDLISDFCERYSDGAAAYFDDNREFKLDVTQASMNIAWDFSDDHILQSITAWREQETPGYSYTNSFAGWPSEGRAFDDGTSTQFSQEFKFTGDFLDGGLRYTTGLYFMQDDSDNGLFTEGTGVQGVFGASTAPGLPPGLVAGATTYREIGQDADNTTYAVYTQWSWDATNNLELTAGLRYGYEERELETQRTEALPPWEAYADIPGAIIIPGTAALFPLPVFFESALDALPLPLGETQFLEAEEDFDSLTPMLSAAYSFPEGMLGESVNALMVYASYTEGYKAGGFSDFGTGELVPFDEENIASFELGLKLDAFENRVRFNAALFSMDYDDMQLFVARPDPRPEVISTNRGVTNAGAATIEGLELEASWIPADGWLINLNASFADGEFDEFDDFVSDPETGLPIPLDRSDEDLPSLPETSVSFGVQYGWETSFGSWTARADAYYRDEMYWGFDALTWEIPLAREEATTDSFTLFNARLNWQINDSLAVTAWGKNLGDKRYYDAGTAEATNLGHVIKTFAPPRRYGVDIRYDF